MRIALLADLAEAVGPDSRSEASVFVFEVADALRQAAAEMGMFSVDLVAKRGSWRGLPLVSIDPDEVPLGSTGPCEQRLRQEAVYCQFILSGMLREYDIVHCVAPLITPIQVLAFLGKPVLQTRIVSPADPTAQILPSLVGSAIWDWTSPLPLRDAEKAYVPPSADLERFRQTEESEAGYLLWLGGGDGPAAETARLVAQALDKPLRVGISEEPVSELQHASLVLDLATLPSPAGPLWQIRALACGVPLAGWEGAGLEHLMDSPENGALAPPGDWPRLCEKIAALSRSPEAAALRRQTVLRRFSRRPVVAQYLAHYRSLLARQ